ncbi:hypothetical protein ACFE04_010198 [Oxalis oulophora]
MEENPARVSRNKDGFFAKKNKKRPSSTRGNQDFVGCSGRYCKSCTGEVISDGVAVCCCPCAVVSMLTLALIKMPYMIGKKCFGIRKNKRRRSLNRSSACRDDGEFSTINVDMVEIEKLRGGGNVRCEAEKVWLELYHGGNLGFGRV